MKQLEVTIIGQSYLLACPEGGEAQLQAAVALVDREMTAIRNAGKVKARERIAVLAALNMAYLLAQAPPQAVELPLASNDPGAKDTSPSELAHDDALVQSLIERLDTALEKDGQLL
jgi:cell division protein ZapA